MFGMFGLGPAELVFLLFTLLVFGFWVWMLVNCLQMGPSEGNDKIIWVLVIVVLGPLGAFLYFVVQRNKWKRN